MNTTTKRHPRTLNEAFGPYANELSPLREFDPMHKTDRASLVVFSIIAAAVVALMAFGIIR